MLRSQRHPGSGSDIFSSRIRFPEQVLIVAKFHKDKKYKDSEEKVRKSPQKCAGSENRDQFIPDPDPRGKNPRIRIPNTG
jgi:hypothetical protein